MKNKKYVEIYKIVKDKIISGDYKPGEKLPSKRVMADKEGCSTITIENAYGMLCDEGYVEAKERSGYFVKKIDAIFADNKKEIKGFSYIEEEFYEMEEWFECSLWFKTIRKVISEKGEKLFFKSPNMGCAVLRNAIADYLRRYRGMYATPQRIVIGSGAEQLYGSVINLLGRDKIYGIENPSYYRIEAVYKAEEAKIKKLEIGQDGIKSSELFDNDIDVLHVTPYKSYPTNITTSLAKKYEYLKWTQEKKFIIEDDFNSEFFMPGKPVESLYSVDRLGRVIYINTFSKSLSASMRIGYMIIPEKLIQEYEKKLGMLSCSVPVLDQYVLAEYISSGNFERHLNRMRRKNKN